MAVTRTETDPRLYVIDGLELPGVTDILTDAGYIDKDRYDTFGKGGFYRDRGQYVHEACELIDRGHKLDFGSLTGYEGYVKAYMAAKEKIPYLNSPSVAIEEPIGDKTLRFGGTPDRRYISEIVDFKTSKATAPWWILQMAAYGILHTKQSGPYMVSPFPDLYVLQLKEDGTFRELLLNPDLYVYSAWRFLAALVQFHQRRKLPAKDMLALVTAAVETISALQLQRYALSTLGGRNQEGQVGGVLANRNEGESPSGKDGGDAVRPATLDQSVPVGGDQGSDAGRNERPGAGTDGQPRPRRRKVPASDALPRGVPTTSSQHFAAIDEAEGR